MSLVLITHDLRVAFAMCDRIYVLYAGSVLEISPAADLERAPMHPYSLALLLSEPSLEHRLAALATVEGTVATARHVADDVAHSQRDAAGSQPVLRPRTDRSSPRWSPDRFSACIRIEEIGDGDPGGREPGRSPGRRAVLVRSRQATIRSCAFATSRRAFGTVEALQSASIDVYGGESVGLVGESGSGKSTLARCLLGLEQADRGHDRGRRDRRD